MGWDITHDPKKGYQIMSTVSDTLIHKKKWLTEEETKAVMAEVALYDFFEKLIKIDMDFLLRYHVNDKINFDGELRANRWMIDNNDQIPDEAQKILKRLLDITLKEDETNRDNG